MDENLLVIDRGNRCVGSDVEDTVHARFAVRFPRCLASTGALFPGTAGRASAEDRLKSAAAGEAASTQLGYHVVSASLPTHSSCGRPLRCFCTAYAAARAKDLS